MPLQVLQVKGPLSIYSIPYNEKELAQLESLLRGSSPQITVGAMPQCLSIDFPLSPEVLMHIHYYNHNSEFSIQAERGFLKRRGTSLLVEGVMERPDQPFTGLDFKAVYNAALDWCCSSR